MAGKVGDRILFCSQAIQIGAVGIVSNMQLPQTPRKAIKKVYDGEAWIDHSMMAHLIKSITHNHPSGSLDSETESINKLSDRGRQVIQLVGLGLKNKRIASQLSLKEDTVRHHLTSIYCKLGVSNRLNLLILAHHSRLTVPKESGSK